MKPEAKLYRDLKKNIPSISWNRLENRSYKIRLSPHQISFHVKHPKNTFILVACTPERGLVRLYPGSKILQLVDSGLKLEPLCAGWDACRLELERL
jgi:hypothetical protein